MRAAVYEEYGGPEVMRVIDVPTPKPADDEVLIRVRATTVSSGDARIRALNLPPGFGLVGRAMFGFNRPRNGRLGNDAAGVVEAVGNKVQRFKQGDEVFAATASGSHAEFVLVKEDGAIVPKPVDSSFADAATLPFGPGTAHHFFRAGKLQPGEHVLVVGASGAVGTAAVQLARHARANVTGVCSGANAELVRSLGADAVIDYAEEDFAAGGERFDIIMDTTGTAPMSRSRAALKPGGRLLVVLGSLGGMLSGPLAPITSGRQVVAPVANPKRADLEELAGLLGNSLTPVIGRRFSLDEIVEAHRYVDTGRKVGAAVITFD